jgi:ATP-dependent DNA helicase 2 subunit 1
MFDDFEDNGGEEEDSSDAEYADIDATADDNVFGGTQKDKTSVSEKESIVFLVDCAKTNRLPISKNYFYYGDDADDENTRESEQTQKSSNYVQVALNAYRNVLRDRVVCTPDDEIGLVFYNTKNRSGELEFDNIFVFHELAPITAERVGAIANFIDNGEFGEMLFEDQIGSSNYGEEEDKEKEEENAMNHALWTASHMLSRNAKTRRSAYVFTNDDAVFRSKKEAEGTSSMGTPKKEKKKSKSNRKTAKEATIARCEEMANAGVKLELFPGPKIGDDGKLVERDGEKEYAFQNFDVSEGSFWREALRKFRYARKKREKKEMTRRRKIVMQTLKDAGDDEEVQRMLKEEEEAWMERRKIRNNGIELQQHKTVVKDTLNNNNEDERASDEDECLDIVLSSKTRVENLEVVSRRKVTRRRPRKTKVWFNDGTFALPFTVVHLVQKTTKPAPKYVDAEDHQDLRTETVYLDKESGEVVAPKKSYLEIGPEKQKVIVKNAEKQATYAASKNFHANACKLGMHCLGFVDTSEVTQRDRLLKGQGKFVRADETVFGGKEAFSALLTACAERHVSVLCADVYNAKSQVKYVALIPQVENDAYLGVPAGFHVVKVPFRDDLRQPEKAIGKSAPQTSATEDQIQAAEALVESLELQEYHPTRISNPELQAHYKALEAIALNKRKVEKISDDTAPPIEQLWKEHGVIAHIRNFSQTTYGIEQQDRVGGNDEDADEDDDGNGIIGLKRKARGGPSKGGEKALKTVVQEIRPGFETFVKRAKKGSLSELTVDVLKTYLDAHNLPKSGNKASIISRIEKHAKDLDTAKTVSGFEEDGAAKEDDDIFF